MYDSLDDLPFVCQINLPEAAQRVYREAFNRAWNEAKDEKTRHHHAQAYAWSAVREQFERDRVSGRWMPKTALLQPRIAVPKAKAKKRSAQ